LQELSSTFESGKIVREGVKLIIVGRPNVGKSSLLNALLKEDRAIVTELPGTTRDSLEENIDIKGILFKIVDTAGIIETNNIVEHQGIIRTERHLDTTDFIIHVFDSSDSLTSDDLKIAEKISERKKSKTIELLVILNKIDLDRKLHLKQIPYKYERTPIIEISALKMIGIEKLENTLYQIVSSKSRLFEDTDSEIVITKTRHIEALKKAIEDLEKARNAINENISPEFIAFDIRNALDNLGEIIGTVTSEEILDNIFNTFCIGK